MKEKKSKYTLLYLFAKLIRIENLIMIALVLYVANDYIIRKEGVGLPMSYLIVLILSTTFIAAGGYVINDYFDLKIDRINRPDEVIIEKTIHRKAAILWHLFFSILGFVGGVYLGIKVEHISFSIIQLLSIVLLVAYSNVLKKIFIVGNLAIALLTGLLPMLPYIYVNALYPQISILTLNALLSLSAFAFFTTIIRELIKDIQDMEGDKEGGRNTIPVRWGLLPSKIIVFFLTFLLIIFLIPFNVYYILKNNFGAVIYNVIFLIIPSIILMILDVVIKDFRQFGWLSALMKLIMLTGVVFYYIF
ncbi:MAG: prenyltransferase [Bacteroidia bacterium]|nr:MAG: prenyltransferase [Bacteroidia bacterium]